MTELNTFNSLETTVVLVFAGFLIGLCVGSMIRDYEHAEEEKICYGESRIFPFDKGLSSMEEWHSLLRIVSLVASS